MTIRAGALLTRMTVYEEQLVDRPDGGQDVTRVPIVTDAPATMRPLGATERASGGAQFASATHRATLRLPRDASGRAVEVKMPATAEGLPTPAMTVDARSLTTGLAQTFQVVGVLGPFDDETRGRELELLLVERVT